MGYFDTEAGVDEYIRAAEGYDGSALIERLKAHLSNDSSVLELGMGPGKDLNLLNAHFQATGSDNSEVFVNRYLSQHPSSDVLVLDAIQIETSRKFDAIYSNKVLHQLTQEQLKISLASQHRVLTKDGLALHSLWHGTRCEKFGDMLSQQYTIKTFSQLLNGHFEIIESFKYAEMEPDDSLCLILKRLNS